MEAQAQPGCRQLPSRMTVSPTRGGEDEKTEEDQSLEGSSQEKKCQAFFEKI